MLILNRLLILLCIALMIMSIYHDLSKTYSPVDDNTPEMDDNFNINYTVVSIKISSGDTLLSINEQLNPHFLTEVDIEQLLEDFMVLNPSVDPQQLKVGNTYYFPKYQL